MLDPRLIRQELDQTAKRLSIKNFDLDVDAIASLEASRKEVQVATETLQAERNVQSKLIGKAKSAGEDIEPLLHAVEDFSDKLDALKRRFNS